MSVHVETNLWPLPLPRVYLWILATGDRSADLVLGLELSDRQSDPVARLEFTWPWNRPRPWKCEVEFPPKRRGWQQWRWRQPWEPIQQ